MTRAGAMLLVCALTAAAQGCSKPQPTPGATSAPAGSASGATSASAAASASAAPAKDTAAGTYEGDYNAAAGTLYIPDDKDWANVKWKGDDGGLTGKGALSLQIAEGGRVEGTSTGGPLGDAIVNGMLMDGVVTGTISRKDPSDEGLTGTLHGKRQGDAITGTMRLAGGYAQKVREARFELKKK
ncbi:MAG: hypothetical protein R3B36_17180 [Polyangiaceae bacterium]